MLELSNLCHCVQHPWKLTSRDYWTSRNERKPLSQLKHVFRKCSGVSQKWWMLELSKLCHCVQYPWKLTNRDFLSSRNERKPLCKQKCVLRKCCGVSQKWWMLELSNFCHCVQHPWKLTSRNFWSSGNAPNTPLTPLHPMMSPWHPQMATPYWLPRGVTYQIETRQVTQMSYAALYKHVALIAVTIYKCVHT